MKQVGQGCCHWKSRGLAAALGALAVSGVRAGTTIDPAHPHAFGANIGWIDARPSVADGAVIGRAYCSGYLWSANCGWIGLGAGVPANGWEYAKMPPTTGASTTTAKAAWHQLPSMGVDDGRGMSMQFITQGGTEHEIIAPSQCNDPRDHHRLFSRPADEGGRYDQRGRDARGGGFR